MTERTHPPLLLASSSPYRREALERLRLPFEAVSPDLDERPRAGETPEALVLRLAEAKARALADDGRIVIGSDQVAVLDGQMLGKPGDEARAREQLAACSGRTVEFLTAVCVLDPTRDAAHLHVDHTRVRFRSLDPATIRRYVETEHPLDCAGSFKCEGLGIALFEAVENEDPTALVGLPLIALARILRDLGVEIP